MNLLRPVPTLVLGLACMALLLGGCQADDKPASPGVTHQNPHKKSAVKYAPQDVHEKDAD